jgi:predicted ArsR family transcriptional regulator
MTKMTARHKILEHLKKRQSATASQIGRALNMSAPNVRHHLSILLSDGRIELFGETRKIGRGRPVKVYRPSEKLLGDNLAILSSSLMSVLLNNSSVSKQQETLQNIAKLLSDQIGNIDPNTQSTKRLANLVEKLNGYHYQARWEAGAEGPRILFGRCPYAAIIEKHPELCTMDGFMLEREMSGQARQLAKIDQKAGGNTHCIFLVR